MLMALFRADVRALRRGYYIVLIEDEELTDREIKDKHKAPFFDLVDVAVVDTEVGDWPVGMPLSHASEWAKPVAQ